MSEIIHMIVLRKGNFNLIKPALILLTMNMLGKIFNMEKHSVNADIYFVNDGTKHFDTCGSLFHEII